MIIANELTRTFSNGTVRALDHVSVGIREGEMVGIIGKNGAGKTTFLKLAAGLLAPSEGEIWTFESNPCENIVKNRQKIGFLSADYRAMEFITTLKDGCDMQRAYFHVGKEEYDKVYQEIGTALGVPAFYKRPLGELSAGEYRCAEFFHAVLHRPKLLFLDEPTIGLDERTKGVICEMVRRLNQRYQTTVLMASHDMDTLQNTCSRVLLLREGELEFDGSWTHLKQISDTFRKARFQSEQMIDFEDLPIRSFKYENGNMELLFSQRQIKEEELYEFLMRRGAIRDFRVEEPPLEVICREVLKGGI